MDERKRTKGQIMLYKTIHRKLMIEQQEPKTRGDLRCSGRVMIEQEPKTRGDRRCSGRVMIEQQEPY